MLLFKTMTDSSIRVIFTNEMGVTFFDFEFEKDGGFKVVSCIKQIDKKLVINKLKSDLGLLIMQGINVDYPEILVSGNETYYSFVLNNERVYYVTDVTCSQLFRIETASKRHRKTLVNLFGYASGMPDSVYLAQQSFEYNISLKKIIR